MSEENTYRHIYATWWRVVQSVLTPKDVDIYARFTGVLHGNIMDAR